MAIRELDDLETLLDSLWEDLEDFERLRAVATVSTMIAWRNRVATARGLVAELQRRAATRTDPNLRH